MKTITLGLVAVSASIFAPLCDVPAQEIVPSIAWEQLDHDSACVFYSVLQTDDGGYILGGSLYFIADDVSLEDIHGVLVKIDRQGNVQWQKRYGGRSYEDIDSVRQTSDGGYVFVGSSDSPPSGNKEAPNIGVADAWLVKVDSEGNKQWDRSFGGTGGNSAASVWQTTDGGYIFAGWSSSLPSGNKESPNFGLTDGWIVKVDAQGTKEWDRSFGGESREEFTSVRQTPDGGYLLAGSSGSPPSGNKEAPHFGESDGWLIKVGAEGNKQWEKSFGGTEGDGFASLDRTADGGFILGGRSRSPPSGNKESFHFGGLDYWIVKVDAAGNKQWERSYGTPTLSEVLKLVRQTSDEGYVLGGISQLIKTDAQGNRQWDAFFGSGDPMNSYAEIYDLWPTKDGGYIVCGFYQPLSANMSGFGCNASSWVVKLENVVARAGEVVTWKADAGVVLESLEDLKRGWKADESEILSLGAANAIALTHNRPQCFYRLRTGASTNSPSLSFGALLSWPTNTNQRLEFSSAKDGPWQRFSGDQGTIEDTHYAIIPQNLKDHYFRARAVSPPN